MKIEQIYTGCLAQGAYYIESGGEAAIVDPLREVDPYIDRAKKDGTTIKYIFETHFHADFVSGHLNLAEKTGAKIVFGPTAETSFDSYVAFDGEEFRLGKVVIKALHTPGHTMESTSYLIKDHNGKDYAIFSGDTLFLGDVGRPDLAQKAANMTQEQLAGLLYDSLRTKIMTLDDSVIVYPAHGAGSACGKNMSSETVGTIGGQKLSNYALRGNMTKEQFIKEVTDGLLPPPEYFPANVKLNREGYATLDTLLERGILALEPDTFEKIADQHNALVLDVRNHSDFSKSFIPGSIFIGLDGDFAPWAGTLIADIEQPILFIAPEGRKRETITRLSRVGFDNVVGFLTGGIDAWRESGREVDSVESISANELEILMQKQNDVAIHDVRKPNEYHKGHITIAENTPLAAINQKMDVFKGKGPFYLHCAGGYRSVIATSILKSRGYNNIINVNGGYAAIEETDIRLIT